MAVATSTSRVGSPMLVAARKTRAPLQVGPRPMTVLMSAMPVLSLSQAQAHARLGLRPARALPVSSEEEPRKEKLDDDEDVDADDASSVGSWTDLIEVFDAERQALEAKRTATDLQMRDAWKEAVRRELATASRFVRSLRGAVLKALLPNKD